MREEETILRELGESKHIYEEMRIPKELDDRVQWAIAQSKAGDGRRIPKKRSRGKAAKWAGMAAALGIAFFVWGLNTNMAFAATMEEVPVLGNISRVLTFRDYEERDGDKTIVVKEPQIQTEEKENTEFVADVNGEIERAVETYKADAAKQIAEYKSAFLATGGTEEEFTEKNIRVDVNYDVTYESDTILSLVLTANENWCGAYGVQYYYNIDMKNRKLLTLKELLGEDWVNSANAQIREQMEERMAADASLVYWEDFTGVNEDTGFYLNKNGHPVVVFGKYEIAPGSAGIQEFELENKPLQSCAGNSSLIK
ncbi:MAG: RsiV family protein [Acetatifactor sp.]